MKYVVCGASGNTGKPIAKNLLEMGHEVVAVSRDKKNIDDLLSMGATGAYGELQDEAFLIEAFMGADAVYALIPPNAHLDVPWRVYQRRIIAATANALQINQIKFVVILSSMGSQLPSGAGPISGLYEFEHTLQLIEGLNIYALRPAYFMTNFFTSIFLIKNLHILGNCIPGDFMIPLIHIADITDAATKKMANLDFNGFEKGFLAGPRDYNFFECVAMMAKALPMPDLKYVQFENEEYRNNMINAGVNPEVANGYMNLFNSLKSGRYLNDFVRTEENSTPRTFEDFLPEFVSVFNAWQW